MKLFSKRKQPVTLNLQAITNGEIMPLEAVADEVFSAKMMGDGYAIQPTDNRIYAPVAGTISSVFPTKHALGITTDDGLELLIHIGLDTVELAGQPFNVLVNEGDIVKVDQPLVDVDFAAITTAGKGTTSMVIITNMDAIKTLTPPNEQTVQHGDLVQTISM